MSIPMKSDGKRLENLVAFVEQTLLPAGFTVTTNDRVYNDEGVQIAEFDVQARGRIGTTDFAWLIECRDRPASGPAPVSWIEQLVGRRERFRFNKVTAVSTTGFAAGAAEFAVTQGIELREVRSLTAEAFGDWLQLRYIIEHVRHTTLLSASFLLDRSTPKELHDALGELLPSITGKSPVLRSSRTGEMATPLFAFAGAVNANEHLYDGLVPNGDGKRIRLHATYPEDDHFIIDTQAGSVDIPVIVFSGELRLKQKQVPLVYTGEYRGTPDGESISQIVSFGPQSIMGMKFGMEMHRLAETGETHVLLRRLPDDA
jgi:restriction endonuclease